MTETIRIKPLEFEAYDANLHVAKAFGYDYEILLIDQDQEFWLCVSHCGNGFYNLRCKTLKSAIEAANTHFQTQFAEWLGVKE